MKKLGRLAALVCLGTLGLSSMDAQATTVTATSGRQNPTSSENCWGPFYGGMQNGCNAGTTNTSDLLIPAQVAPSTTYNLRVRASGQFQQTGPWVSCVAVNYKGISWSGGVGTALISISARATTSHTTIFDEDLNLGTLTTPAGNTSSVLYFECAATNQGFINWAAFYP